MSAPIIPYLADMFAEKLTVQPGALDAYGNFAPSGASFEVDCHYSGQTRLVRDPSGREVTSSLKATVAGVFGLTVEAHRYTLPARFKPRENLTAIAVPHAADENGSHHESVIFP